MFGQVESLLQEIDMTPADVAEKLMPKSAEMDADLCLRDLVSALEKAKEAQETPQQQKQSKKILFKEKVRGVLFRKKHRVGPCDDDDDEEEDQDIN